MRKGRGEFRIGWWTWQRWRQWTWVTSSLYLPLVPLPFRRDRRIKLTSPMKSTIKCLKGTRIRKMTAFPIKFSGKTWPLLTKPNWSTTGLLSILWGISSRSLALSSLSSTFTFPWSMQTTLLASEQCLLGSAWFSIWNTLPSSHLSPKQFVMHSRRFWGQS